jgi:uncharacterized protein YggU (UPF0235/DUF167 family)
VQAHPKAKHERLEMDGTGGFKIWTTAPADKGAANAAITKLLAKELGVAPSRLTLKRGATSRQKVFELDD